MPEKTRRALQGFIRQVREVVQLEGAYIGCPDGTRFGPIGSGDGYTFLYKDDSIAFCDILLESALAELTPAQAIGTILHELAHARDNLISPRKMVKTPSFISDTRAWSQAIEWASAGLPDPGMSREIEYWALLALIQIQTDRLAELVWNDKGKKGS